MLLYASVAVAQRDDADDVGIVASEALRVDFLSQEVDGTSTLFRMDGHLWTCNDHGALRLYALDTLTAAIDSVVDLGVSVYDLEEVTLDKDYLYFGDFGDNNGTRSDLRILRLARRDLARGRYRFDTIAFHYPERSRTTARNFDCEAFVAGADSLYLFTKQWASQNTVCYALPKRPGTYAASRRFSLMVDGLVTGACLLDDGSALVLLGYSFIVKPFVYLVTGFDGEHFDQGRGQRIALANPLGTQTEGIATFDGLRFFVSNETLSLRFFSRHAALLRLDLSGFLR